MSWEPRARYKMQLIKTASQVRVDEFGRERRATQWLVIAVIEVGNLTCYYRGAVQ